MSPEERSPPLLWESTVAAAWGLAEATVFFVVPDVCLTYFALRSLRRALVSCAFATLGAIGGGALMYAWGAANPAAATRFLDRVPAVSAEMIEGVEQALADGGPGASVPGAFLGTPYKIYAVKAAALDLSLPLFLLWSIPARLGRFAAAVLLVRIVVSTVGKRWSRRKSLGMLAIFWLLFYAAFLTLMPS